MNKTVAIIFTIVFALFASCKSKQSLTRSGEKATSTRHLVKLIEQAEPNFTTLNASNISINLSLNGTKRNVSASLKIKTDSVIVLSIIPFLGIEMFSIEFYPEEWIVFDKINRVYYTDNYEYLYYKLGIDANFNAFQSLFSARLFAVGEEKIDVKKLKFIPLESNKSKLEFESKNIKQNTVTHSNHTIEQVILTDKDETHKLTTTYNDYVELRGINYPRNTTIELFNENNIVVGLNMRIQKITFNSDLKLSSSNPERYTKSTLDQLIK